MPALVCCIQIDLSENDIDAEGAKAIADALKGNASLSRLDVSYNELDKGGNGVQLLRDAVREREGFVLIDGEEAEMDESSAYTSDEDDRYTSD